jgi:hypothetical protein
MPDLVERITEVIRAHRLQFLDQWICPGCRKTFENIREADAHVGGAVAAEIRSQIPSVAFKAEGRTDTEAFREAAAKLDAGFQPGGGNVAYAVSRLLREAATVLEGCTTDELATRAQRGWAPAGGVR